MRSSLCFISALAVVLLMPSLLVAEVPTFSRVFVVLLENLEFWEMNVHPSMNSLAQKGLLLTNYKATTHPSQPNYISIIAGDTMGVKSDSDHDIEGKNLVDLLEEKGVTWKAYQEDYPGNCFTGSKSNKYVRKHNPFISFDNIRLDSTRCSNIVHSDQLWADIDANNLPQFMFYSPNMYNNGHDSGPLAAAKWSSSFISSLLSSKGFDETLIVLTADEGLMIGPNMIFTLLIGPGVSAATQDNTPYNHYSLLRFIEDNFGVGTLGRNDDTATPFKFINNPPGWVLTLGGLIGICVAAFVVFAAAVVGVTLLIIRRYRKKKMMRLKFNDITKVEARATDGASVEMKNVPPYNSLGPEV